MLDGKSICYVSAAIKPMAQRELEIVLEAARPFSETNSVTGALLHDDGSFFHYFEGPAGGVDAFYAAIKTASWHTGIIELLCESITKRSIPKWYMGSTDVPQSSPLSLRLSEWKQLKRHIDRGHDQSPSVTLLRVNLERTILAF
ncbi:MAG: BLUF domain-containing protein [Pseudomonadota bacterium]